MFAELVIEPNLRQAQVQRSLAAFKSRALDAAGAGFLALLAFPGGLAQTGTKATAYTNPNLLGARCRT